METLTSIGIMVAIATTLASILGKIIEKWVDKMTGSNSVQETDIALLKADVHKILTNDLVHNENCHQRLEIKINSMSEDIAIIKSKILER